MNELMVISLMHKLYNPYSMDAAYEISLYLDYGFMKRTALNVRPYINLCNMKHPLVWPILGRFYFMHKCYKSCLKDAAYEITLYLDYWFISHCKMKRPLVGPISSGFYFHAQVLQMSPGCCISNIRVFVMPVHEKKIFFKFIKFSPFFGSNRCQPLDFCKFESSFPIDGSYQIWLKSFQFGEEVI